MMPLMNNKPRQLWKSICLMFAPRSLVSRAPRSSVLHVFSAFILLALPFRGGAGELVLFEVKPGFDPAKVAAQDAKVSVAPSGAGRVLRVDTGHQQPWPGITLGAPAGRWDLSAFARVSVAVKNTGTNHVSIVCRVDNPGADGVKHCVSGSASLRPGEAGMLNVELPHGREDTLGGKLFGLRGYPVASGASDKLDPAAINQLLVFVGKPAADHCFEISQIRAEGAWTPPTAWVTDADPFFPCIDTFGQYRHKDWPGKTHSLEEMTQRREAEARAFTARPGPQGWNRYGGWAGGPQLKATGFFRTEKHQGKWWLVDPEGRLFFSHGIDCVRMLDCTPVEEREQWFDAFPGSQSDFKEFVISRAYALKGHYAGRSPQCFSFAGANLKRKYGGDWKDRCPEIIHQRLRHWGLNTIGMWSDEGVRSRRLTPYVDAIGSGGSKQIEGSEGYWGKFPDPFDPSFKERLNRSMAAKAGQSAGDPWCLGYFADNELGWGDETSLSLGVLQSAPEQAAKQAFVADLKAKYSDIQKLNQSWGSTHASWDALLQSRTAPDKAKAKADLAAFYTRVAEEYFHGIRDAIKAVAPQQLYLGCRFAWANARATAAAAKYCDIVSFNLYQRDVANFQFNGGADVPLIIGEFHFGALDRGMFHTGLVPVASQAERAQTYCEYVRGALRHPALVGCHWFQYQDEPTTGRVYDEENYQIGFVDIADTPYAETIEASRAVGDSLYSYRLAN